MRRVVRRLATRLAGLAGALLLLACRLTVRCRTVADPRPSLRRAGRPYVYALLHAHQLAAVLVNDEPRLAAMVSRSADGDLLVPALRARHIEPVRGSSRNGRRDKGGRTALAALGAALGRGQPALIAVDGPRGPRNRVRGGVVALARAHGASILPVVVVSSRRWILRRTWDRFQIPKPFAQLSLAFGAPLRCDPEADDTAMRKQLTLALQTLEQRFDPQEVQHHHASP